MSLFQVVDLLLQYEADPYSRMQNPLEGERDELSAFELLLSRNPKAADAFMDAMIATNGEDLDSPDLLLVFDMEVFDQVRLQMFTAEFLFDFHFSMQ